MEPREAVGILSRFFKQPFVQFAVNEASQSCCHLKDVQVQVLQYFWNSECINNELQLCWVHVVDISALFLDV